ncbi:Zn-dependent hydrolase [Solibacillus sp. FSL W7-1436]|uniref:Zn-dependent hydrolase n=1 Tax=Solibacillus sp. FSL W7-1436 TaxID=2921705 RepID=UPI0030F71507
MIQIERISNRLNEVNRIGFDERTGGINRHSFTIEEQQAIDLITQYMQRAGMSVSIDAIGNVIGQMGQGEETIMLGSHIDTVPDGGRFDGLLGVIAAIEVAQTLSENHFTFNKTLKVVAFKDEEGTRFGFGLIGSKAMAGLLTEEHLQMTDANGISIAEAMQSFNLSPALIKEAEIQPISAYLELHIEQGKVLENLDVPVGIVTGIAGPLWLEVTIEGLREHAGATPMNIRQDALTGASEIIVEIEKMIQQYAPAVATVGKLNVEPNGINVIPGKVVFVIDLRDIDEQLITKYEQNILQIAQTIAHRRQLKLTVRELQRVKPAQADAVIQQCLATQIEKHNLPVHHLVSGAGHDAMFLAQKAPMGMLFVRSKDGISHNPLEYTSLKDIEIATHILYDTTVALLTK